jgi:hypothetical protein
MNARRRSINKSASVLISKRIAELRDWRGKILGRMRKLIQEADPDVVEEWKWMGPAKGASLKDPARLFNSSLDRNVRRAIDIREAEEVDAAAFKALVRQAVAFNSKKR